MSDRMSPDQPFNIPNGDEIPPEVPHEIRNGSGNVPGAGHQIRENRQQGGGVSARVKTGEEGMERTGSVGTASPSHEPSPESGGNPPQKSVISNEGNSANVSSVQSPDFAPLSKTTGSHVDKQAGIGMLMDVTLRITAELGRAELSVRELLDLQSGSVVELDRMAGEDVDIFINDRLLAKGEVVVVDDMFGVRITELISSGL
jgi:flagellar motor switch protein FliN/FliY